MQVNTGGRRVTRGGVGIYKKVLGRRGVRNRMRGEERRGEEGRGER